MGWETKAKETGFNQKSELREYKIVDFLSFNPVSGAMRIIIFPSFLKSSIELFW